LLTVELTMHMQKEELLLFPYVKKMEEAQKENKNQA
jgi:iron-sulfur cluster repair protein YtfE (RIC family)